MRTCLDLASFVSLAALALPLSFLSGCSSSSDAPATTDSGAGGDTGTGDVSGDTPAAGPKLAVACADALDGIYGDPGALPTAKGAIVKCARDAHLTVADVQAKLDAVGYKGGKATSGAYSYRVVFRSNRGDGKNTPVATSAIVFLPETPRAAKMPVTLFARASRGQAPDCAPSKHNAAADSVNPDLDSIEMLLVGNGFPVIVSDGPGLVNPGPSTPLPAYFSATDMGQSVLDSGAALRALVPAETLNDKVLIVGHSEGAADAISSLAIAEKYGVAGTIAGVAAFAPIWFSPRAWGAEFVLAADYPSAKSPAVSGIVLWYNYTHAELFDGPGAGKKLFKADKADAAEKFARTRCWGQWDDVIALGTDTTSFFDPAFVNAVESAASVGADCDTAEPAHTICTTWMARYDADRPHLTGAAATTPILTTFGLKDTFVGQDRYQCTIDRFATDKANLTYCLDKDADHGGITRAKGEYALKWLAAKGLGEAEPTKCELDEKANVDSAGKAIPCAALPPNVP